MIATRDFDIAAKPRALRAVRAWVRKQNLMGIVGAKRA